MLTFDFWDSWKFLEKWMLWGLLILSENLFLTFSASLITNSKRYLCLTYTSNNKAYYDYLVKLNWFMYWGLVILFSRSLIQIYSDIANPFCMPSCWNLFSLSILLQKSLFWIWLLERGAEESANFWIYLKRLIKKSIICFAIFKKT